MTVIHDVARVELQGEIAVLTLNSPPVNALSRIVRQGLQEGLRQAVANPAARAIVWICEGRTFCVGADISEFGKALGEPLLPELVGQFEDCPKPLVAALHGTALGGGLELALACHERVAVPSTRCGLPEVALGILPGAGGTQRLPRVVGARRALEMIVLGEPVPAPECLELGLIDAIVPEGELLPAAIERARSLLAGDRPLRRVRDMDEKLAEAREHPDLFDAFRAEHARALRGFEAPDAAIRAIQAAVERPFEDGLEFERRAMVELLRSEQSAALRYVFFAERQVWKIPDVPAEAPPLPVERVGIVGAGTMGGGIAMCFASAGIPVTIVEREASALDRGLGIIRRNYERSAQRGRFSMAEAETRFGLIRGELSLDALADCDLVIEAVFESMKLKREIFTALDGICGPDAILASNTSALDLDEIARATDRPESVIGMHFFSPANVMRLLEVVRGERTSVPVIATTLAIARRIGKIAALVGVCPGFVGNRMLFARQAQAQALLVEGALPWDVDRVLYEFGMPMGPFAMADLAGLDIGWNRERSRGESLRDRLCERNRRGQKTGAGFYDYDENRKPSPSPVVEELIRDFVRERGGQPRSFTDAEIVERLAAPMINEGAKLLQEGKALRASDIDVVWLHGYGWPRYRGGPMYHADRIGLDRVIACLEELSARFGAGLEPAELLRSSAREGRALHSR